MEVSVDWDVLNRWIAVLREEVIGARLLVRGRRWTGLHMRVWGRNSVDVVLHGPVSLGQPFISSQTLHADVNYERLLRLVRGGGFFV